MRPTAHRRIRTWQHCGVPPYVHASIALVAATIVVAIALPSPRLHPSKAGTACLVLMVASGAIFLAAAVVILLSMTASLPGYIVMAPALAALGVAAALVLVMCWMAASEPPESVAPGADGSEDDDGGGGGGGGLRPEDDPPRDPGPSDGIDWDSFDAERAGWESSPTLPGRDLIGV